MSRRTCRKMPKPSARIGNKLTVTDFGGIYRRPHVHSEIRWPQVLFQKQVIAKSSFLDLLTREAGKASHMTVNLSKEPLFEAEGKRHVTDIDRLRREGASGTCT